MKIINSLVIFFAFLAILAHAQNGNNAPAGSSVKKFSTNENFKQRVTENALVNADIKKDGNTDAYKRAEREITTSLNYRALKGSYSTNSISSYTNMVKKLRKMFDALEKKGIAVAKDKTPINGENLTKENENKMKILDDTQVDDMQVLFWYMLTRLDDSVEFARTICDDKKSTSKEKGKDEFCAKIQQINDDRNAGTQAKKDQKSKLFNKQIRETGEKIKKKAGAVKDAVGSVGHAAAKRIGSAKDKVVNSAVAKKLGKIAHKIGEARYLVVSRYLAERKPKPDRQIVKSFVRNIIVTTGWIMNYLHKSHVAYTDRLMVKGEEKRFYTWYTKMTASLYRSLAEGENKNIEDFQNDIELNIAVDVPSFDGSQKKEHAEQILKDACAFMKVNNKKVKLTDLAKCFVEGAMTYEVYLNVPGTNKLETIAKGVNELPHFKALRIIGYIMAQNWGIERFPKINLCKAIHDAGTYQDYLLEQRQTKAVAKLDAEREKMTSGIRTWTNVAQMAGTAISIGMTAGSLGCAAPLGPLISSATRLAGQAASTKYYGDKYEKKAASMRRSEISRSFRKQFLEHMVAAHVDNLIYPQTDVATDVVAKLKDEKLAFIEVVDPPAQTQINDELQKTSRRSSRRGFLGLGRRSRRSSDRSKTVEKPNKDRGSSGSSTNSLQPSIYKPQQPATQLGGNGRPKDKVPSKKEITAGAECVGASFTYFHHILALLKGPKQEVIDIIQFLNELQLELELTNPNGVDEARKFFYRALGDATDRKDGLSSILTASIANIEAYQKRKSEAAAQIKHASDDLKMQTWSQMQLRAARLSPDAWKTWINPPAPAATT